MDDPRWLRLVTIGLVLAAIAVGYLLFTGGFSVSKSKIAQTQVTKPSPTPAATPNYLPTSTPTPNRTPSSAYNSIVGRNQGNIQTLPSTGFPVGLVVVFSILAIIFGLSLRKFSKQD